MDKKILSYLDNGIFYGNVLFTVGFSTDQIIAHLKKTKNQEWIPAVELKRDLYNSRGFCSVPTIKGKRFALINLSRFTWNDAESHIVLSHEVVHLCQFFLPDFIGDRSEIECEAYYHSHIMRQCYTLLKPKR